MLRAVLFSAAFVSSVPTREFCFVGFAEHFPPPVPPRSSLASSASSSARASFAHAALQDRLLASAAAQLSASSSTSCAFSTSASAVPTTASAVASSDCLLDVVGIALAAASRCGSRLRRLRHVAFFAFFKVAEVVANRNADASPASSRRCPESLPAAPASCRPAPRRS